MDFKYITLMGVVAVNEGVENNLLTHLPLLPLVSGGEVDRFGVGTLPQRLSLFGTHCGCVGKAWDVELDIPDSFSELSPKLCALGTPWAPSVRRRPWCAPCRLQFTVRSGDL